MNLPAIAETLTTALRLEREPVAVCFATEPPAGVKRYEGQAPAGCLFWQQAASATFTTEAGDHALCSIGAYTHNLGLRGPTEKDLKDALKVMRDLTYVRDEDMAAIPVLRQAPRYIVYGPLAMAPVQPDVVLLFVRPDQQLILTEATQQVEGTPAPAMGRPACAVVPHAANSGQAALSLGCCGARAYLDALSPGVALYAIPGHRLEAYGERIRALGQANDVLTRFHQLRRGAVEAGGRPSVEESLAALGQG